MIRCPSLEGAHDIHSWWWWWWWWCRQDTHPRHLKVCFAEVATLGRGELGRTVEDAWPRYPAIFRRMEACFVFDASFYMKIPVDSSSM